MHISGLLVRIFVVTLLGAGGCIIPPSLSVDNLDAGQNSPPAILAVRSDEAELPEQSTVIFNRGVGSLNVELLDTDVNDTLQVRVFVNYTLDNPVSQRSTRTVDPQGTAKRTATCDLTALCTEDDVKDGLTLNMSVVVFDRIPLESGTPAFQAMPEGGLSTNRFFFLKCTEAI